MFMFHVGTDPKNLRVVQDTSFSPEQVALAYFALIEEAEGAPVGSTELTVVLSESIPLAPDDEKVDIPDGLVLQVWCFRLSSGWENQPTQIVPIPSTYESP